MLAKKLLKIVREPSAVSQKSGEGNDSSGDGTISETSVTSTRLGGLSRKGSVWSQVAKKLSQKETQKALVPRVKYENTYQLSPDDSCKFDATKVQNFVEELLAIRLKTEEYNPRTVSSLTTNLSDVIKGRIKKMGFKRHKIVCHLVIGEQNSQDVHVTSRCVWDTNTDNSATARYSNTSLFAVATIFAVYFE
ncbi:dynein light chain Tctex-type protein 2B-like [Lytechinus variegatus]|uniref:dynein light chain Tctex-type protein 2B-like n=1 Tax=Lytechinus variegatus TaxID=7654 RepID=UPI001BB26239|nr:dynein light chain Tctex-type protein 2B-like [Lytechinus variegatus]